ncbi:helix-turn-helix domain-containing protein [Chitinophaga agrisoli]|uniref:Helix-turn-helix domain-containing protein n=1 Tax=Chitinophaga agrisoli TaxID=2607653 RepID=A0A5B2VMZ1_9BACT|nr:helix-turn-helix transcriptional regulator [Chitinophaga agrisoli]KAA2239509.1 helix-turn-helix domain-containing protein [Chitinophaga agrisoli]
MKKDLPVYNIRKISDFKSEDIIVSRFAPYLETHPNLCQPHKHDFFHMLLFTKGGGTHSIDFVTFPVTPFQMYFMIPGQVHSWDFEGEVDGIVINFTAPFFKAFLLNPSYLDQFPYFCGKPSTSVIYLPEELQPEILRLMTCIVQESEANQPNSADMIKVLLVALFINLGRLQHENLHLKLHHPQFNIFKKFIDLTDKNITTLRLPSEYADLLCISPNYLNMICNAIIAKPAGEIIRDRVVLEAKRLITNIDLSISEIAYQLNFKDASYFSKFFKKQTGLPPEDFRNSFARAGSCH